VYKDVGCKNNSCTYIPPSLTSGLRLSRLIATKQASTLPLHATTKTHTAMDT
jgi:hypothetical protein